LLSWLVLSGGEGEARMKKEEGGRKRVREEFLKIVLI